MRKLHISGAIFLAFCFWGVASFAATQCGLNSTYSTHLYAQGNSSYPPDDGNCSKDVQAFKLKVYEFGICTSHAEVDDKSMCTTLFEDAVGYDLVLSKNATLPLGSDITLTEGTYTHAYIHVDNVMYLTVSHEFASNRKDRSGNSGKYCYSNGTDKVFDDSDNLTSTIITCSNTAPTTATNLPTKETLTFPDNGAGWGKMVDSLTKTNLFMLNSAGGQSINLASDDSVLASQDITDVVISPNTKGLNIAFTVTDSVSLVFTQAGQTGCSGSVDCVMDSAWDGMKFLVTAN